MMEMENVKRVKLIRDESLGNKQWNSGGVNEWVGSTMQVYLNDTYEINDDSKKMIGNAKWYLGGSAHASANGNEFYTSERSEAVISEDRSKNWTGTVALIYPSDYIYTYALGVSDNCYNTAASCNNGNPSLGWLYKSAYNQWTLTPVSVNTSSMFTVRSGGNIYPHANYSIGAHPTLYLKTNVKIKSGDGSIDSPYEFEL